MYISYFDIIPDPDAETPYSYLQMDGQHLTKDPDPLVDFIIYDWQQNVNIDESSQRISYVGDSADARLAWATENNAFEKSHGDVVVAELLNQINDAFENDIQIIAVDILGEDESDKYNIFTFSNDTRWTEGLPRG